jgi:tetratricopeptide (TPR) repeat protein
MRRGQPLLAAAMIVRDEAERLGACLESIAPVVDEIVIVDTGSSDDSVAIAESYGARVHHQAWADDFSAARNAALDAVQARWVLYVDADERLRPIERSAVVALLEAADEVAFRVTLRPFVGATPAREFRLWRNDPRIRFVGIIHEKVVPAIQAVAEADGRAIGLCDLELDHLGYEHDQSRKHARNLPLLRAQLGVEPGNVYNWHHLATVLGAIGDADEAEAALERACELVRAAADPPPCGVLAYADLVALHRERGDAADLLDEGLRTYPNAPPLLWAKALMDIDAGRHRDALTWIDRLAAIDPGALDDMVSYEEQLFGVRLHHARGVACFGLGRYRDAAEAFATAERHDPDDAELRMKRVLAERLAEHPAEHPAGRTA